MKYTIMSHDAQYAVVMEISGEMRFGKYVVQTPGQTGPGTGGVCYPLELFGRFDTIEQAQAHLDAAHEARNAFDEEVRALEDQLHAAKTKRREAWRAAIGLTLMDVD
jgi:hypothetical protein